MSHQYRLCETLCDKKWMRVVVLQGAEHHTEDDTQQDTSTSWVNEILQAHRMTQFIHLRAIISSKVVLQAVKKEYKEQNQKLRRVLRRVLLYAKVGSLLVLNVLRDNLLHKGLQLCNKLKLVVKQKTVRRGPRHVKQRSTTIKTTKYDMPQLLSNYKRIRK